ncbi:MAG: hypothetical protein HQ567_16375, partial [Candidatus Nealsonbacteria bacterium]|nr:hypothetical protein [Candidatus Nealsonbacteria bacterium]
MFRSMQIVSWVAVVGLAWAAARLEAGPVVLLDSGADEWYYLDDGTDQSTTWREEGFGHAAAGWASGPAPLGFGDLGPAGAILPLGTTVSYGTDAANKYATTYFRREFNVDAVDLAGFTFCTVGVLRDDAAAVYLNGVEIYRDAGLTANAPFDELASGGSPSADNEVTFFEKDFLHTGLLHEGANVVAVEVHQTSAGSSDLGMDLRLTGRDDAVEFGDVTPGIFTGFEEAAAGAMSFTRAAAETELEWDMPDSGATQIASVVDDVTDSDDPNNKHQFHLNNVDDPVQLTTEKIDVGDYIDVQVSIDLRTWLNSGSFEGSDTFALSLSTSTDGFSFTTTPWLEFAGGELGALENGSENEGAFTTFTSDLGLLSDDVLSMRLVIDAEIDSGNEHLMFDNLSVAGVSLSELTWDGSGAAMWGQVLPGPPPDSHWDGGDTDATPGNSTLAIVNSGTPIVDEDSETYRLQVNGDGLIINGEKTLTVIRDAAFADGVSLSVGAGGRFEVGGRLDFGAGGPFTLGAGAALIATTGIDVAAGTTLGMGTGAFLHTGAGTIDRLAIDGDATVNNSGDLVVTTLADGPTAGMLVKQGDGTLMLDNSAAAAGSVSAANTAFRIEVGTLASKGSDPLGGSTAVTLAGGSLALEHDADVTLGGTTLTLAANSGLTANMGGQLSFAGLTANLGTLTIGGTADSVRFGMTILDPAVSVAELGFETEMNTFLGAIDADSATVTITKSGAADLVLDQESMGVDNATFAVSAGRLVALHGPNPLGTAAVELDGGELVLSAKPGSTGPIAYDTPVTVEDDSALTVGATDGGMAGPMDVVLGSAATGLTLNDEMLAVRITDNYTLSVPGAIAGAGGLDLIEGQLTAQQPIDVGSLTLTGGTLVLGGDVRVADALTLTGASLDMTGRRLYTTNATDVTVGTGQTLTIDNQNLYVEMLEISGTLIRNGTARDIFVDAGVTLSGASLDMTGATLHTTNDTNILIAAGQTLTIENQNLLVEDLRLAGTLIRKGTGGDLVVNEDLVLSSTLDMTGSTLLTQAFDTNIVVETGGILTVDHVLGGDLIQVAGTMNLAGAYGNDLEVSDGGVVRTSAAMQFDTVLVTGGEVHLTGQADLVAETVDVTGGLVDTGGSRVIVDDWITLGDVTCTVTGGVLQAGGPDLLNLPTTNLAVTAVVEATVELSSPNDEQILGDLTVQDGVRTLTLASTAASGSTAYRFGNVTAADGLTVDGAMSARGTFATGDRIATVTVGTGELTLADTATYGAKVSLAADAADVIEVSTDGTLQLGGTLAVTGTGRTTGNQWATVTRRIVNGTDGTIGDAGAGTGLTFDGFTPAPGLTNDSHVGEGAFLRKVNYVQSDDAQPVTEAVDLELFVALGGDSDGDGKVWLSDWAALRANFG